MAKDQYDALDFALSRLGPHTRTQPHCVTVDLLSRALAITRTGGRQSRRDAAALIEEAINILERKN